MWLRTQAFARVILHRLGSAVHTLAMRNCLIPMIFVLAACAADGARPPVVPAVPVGAADTCGAAPYRDLVGQPATALERVLIMRPIRLVRPDTAATMDHAPARINFMISDAEQITAIRCG